MTGSAESSARRRITAAALFFSEQNQLLIVRPTYRDDQCWLVPGGIVENDESPEEGCRREVREELGSELTLQHLLCIEYQSPQRTKPQSLHFVFYGGVLNLPEIQQIRLPTDELSEFRFRPWDEALQLLCSRLAERLAFARLALAQQRVIYVEDLHEVGSWHR